MKVVSLFSRHRRTFSSAFSHDIYSVKYTANSLPAFESFDLATAMFLGDRDSPVDMCNTSIKLDPSFAMSHILKTFISFRDGNHQQAFSSLFAATSLVDSRAATYRDTVHVAALQELMGGSTRKAVNIWHHALLEEPRDILTMRFIFDAGLMIGDYAQVCGVLSRSMGHVDRISPGGHFLLGMHSYINAELGNNRLAEANAMEALSVDEGCGLSLHAVLHVMESECRHREGIRMIREVRPFWESNKMLRQHIGLHWLNMCLQTGHDVNAVSHFDNEIYRPAHARKEAASYSSLVDAAIALWKLQLNGNTEIGALEDRWDRLRGELEPYLSVRVSPLHDCMVMMALQEENGECDRHIEMLRAFAADTSTGAVTEEDSSFALDDLYPPSQLTSNISRSEYKSILTHVAIPVCEAIATFKRMQYCDTVAILYPLRYHLHGLGGNKVDIDTIHWTLIEACIRGNMPDLLRSIALERRILNANSCRDWGLVSVAEGMLGNHPESAKMLGFAKDLGWQQGDGHGWGEAKLTDKLKTIFG